MSQCDDLAPGRWPGLGAAQCHVDEVATRKPAENIYVLVQRRRLVQCGGVPNTKASTHRPLPPQVAAGLAKAIRAHREGGGLPQEALAARAHVSVQMIRRLEAGTANPTLGTLHAITTALDISWRDLFIEVEP